MKNISKLKQCPKKSSPCYELTFYQNSTLDNLKKDKKKRVLFTLATAQKVAKTNGIIREEGNNY